MGTFVSTPQKQPFVTLADKDVTTGRFNTVGPNGSTTWTGQPGGQQTQTTTLTPAAQSALTAQQKVGQNLSQGAAAKTPWAISNEAGPMNYSTFMPGGTHVQGGQYYNKAAGDAVYKQFADRQEPQFRRDTAALETQMRNQGLRPGDEAWNDQIRQNNQSIADQREQAQTHAQEVAASEGSRMQGMDVSAGNYNTDQRTQQITEALQKRGYGVDEIKKMLEGMGVSVPGAPNQSIGDTYTHAGDLSYGQDAKAAQNSNAEKGQWLDLAKTALSSSTGKKITGAVIDKIGSWVGFSPADATASTSAGGQIAGPVGTAIGDIVQGKSVGDTAKDTAVNYAEDYAKNAAKGWITGSAAPTAAEIASSIAPVTTAAEATAPAVQIGSDIAAGANYGTGATAGSSSAAAGSSSWLGAAGGVAVAAGAAIALKHLSDNAAGLGYRDSRALADFMHTNAQQPDPQFVKGPGPGGQSTTPMPKAPPGFKSWHQYFAVTQVVQSAMSAKGGKKDIGTYKMLLQEQGVPTDPQFYMKTWPGQADAYKTIIGRIGNPTATQHGGR